MKLIVKYVNKEGQMMLAEKFKHPAAIIKFFQFLVDNNLQFIAINAKEKHEN